MAILARRTSVPSKRKVGLRGGAGPTLPPAPSIHRMGLRNKATLPASSVICPICLSQIGLYDDYLKCVNQCRKTHRNCFESWCGKPCLCKGLLCQRFPMPGFGRAPNYRNTCANCMGPPYLQSLAAITQKWMLVFRSNKSRNYLYRVLGNFLMGIHGRKAFSETYMVVTNNDEHGRNPRVLFNVLRNSGDGAAEAARFIWEMYLISRTTFSQVPGAPFEVRHCLTPAECRVLFDRFMRKLAVPDRPFTLRYRMDRLIYFSRFAINDGRDDPPLTQDKIRPCMLSPLSEYLHTHNGSHAWDDFRKMFERPQAEWGLWN
jgi:hypothetical protein